MDAPLGFDLLHWRALTKASEDIKLAPSFLLSRIFNGGGCHASDTIDMELVRGSESLVPFVTDVEGGTIIEGTTRELQTIKTPRLRPKKKLDAKKLLAERLAGMNIYASGSKDIQAGRAAIVAQELKDLKQRLRRTEEYMCAQALTGKLQVSQANIAFEIDYRFPAAHTDALTGADDWGGASANIPGNIQSWADLIQDESGFPADTLLLGTEAAKAFISDAKIRAELDTRNYSVGQLKLSVGNNYIGNYRGLEVWRYPFRYISKAGSKVKLLGAKAAVMLASQAAYSMEYGLILDLDAKAQVMSRIFSKSWLESDPSVMWMLSESRPLPVVRDVGSVVYMLVLD